MAFAYDKDFLRHGFQLLAQPAQSTPSGTGRRRRSSREIPRRVLVPRSSPGPRGAAGGPYLTANLARNELGAVDVSRRRHQRERLHHSSSFPAAMPCSGGGKNRDSRGGGDATADLAGSSGTLWREVRNGRGAGRAAVWHNQT